MAVDLDEFDDVIAEIEGDVTRAVRPAAQAGAEKMYQIVLGNVDKLGKVTGNLRSAIYQAFSERDSKKVGDGYTVAHYDVSWNHRRAPHAHLVEYGHIQKYKVYLGKDGRWYTNKNAPLPAPKQVAAKPFMRPALSRQAEAVQAVEDRFWQEVK